MQPSRGNAILRREGCFLTQTGAVSRSLMVPLHVVLLFFWLEKTYSGFNLDGQQIIKNLQYAAKVFPTKGSHETISIKMQRLWISQRKTPEWSWVQRGAHQKIGISPPGSLSGLYSKALLQMRSTSTRKSLTVKYRWVSILVMMVDRSIGCRITSR